MGGQFAPKKAGHFESKMGGHFKTKMGGQYERYFQKALYISELSKIVSQGSSVQDINLRKANGMKKSKGCEKVFLIQQG